MDENHYFKLLNKLAPYLKNWTTLNYLKVKNSDNDITEVINWAYKKGFLIRKEKKLISFVSHYHKGRYAYKFK